MKKTFLILCFIAKTGLMQAAPGFKSLHADLMKRTNDDSIIVRATLIKGNLYLLDCVNGFGGGNVAASIGEDGILLVDDMYAAMSVKLKSTLRAISNRPIRLIANTHFHRDHIEGNKILRDSAVIIAQENVGQRLIKNNKETAPTLAMLPMISFNDRATIRFNGEDVQLIHFPNSHTDGDVMVYFTTSKTIHLGDMFFAGMFPAVYAEGGGDIRQLILSIEKIIDDLPADTKVIPGHGPLSSMTDLAAYVTMLKETVHIVETNIKAGKTLEQMKAEKVLAKYDALGEGGAQTTDQYLAMLVKLLGAGN